MQSMFIQLQADNPDEKMIKNLVNKIGEGWEIVSAVAVINAVQYLLIKREGVSDNEI